MEKDARQDVQRGTNPAYHTTERIAFMAGKKAIKLALNRVNESIKRQTDSRCFYSCGLASEGYEGGYSDALSDVLLALNGVPPCRRPGYWADTIWPE